MSAAKAGNRCWPSSNVTHGGAGNGERKKILVKRCAAKGIQRAREIKKCDCAGSCTASNRNGCGGRVEEIASVICWKKTQILELDCLRGAS